MVDNPTIKRVGKGGKPLEVSRLDRAAFSPKVLGTPLDGAPVATVPGESGSPPSVGMVAFACKATFADFETGDPLRRFAHLLNFVVDNAQVHSLIAPPCFTEILMDPRLPSLADAAVAGWKAPPADGYALFCLLRMDPADYQRLKEKIPFLIGEGEPLPEWNERFNDD